MLNLIDPLLVQDITISDTVFHVHPLSKRTCNSIGKLMTRLSIENDLAEADWEKFDTLLVSVIDSVDGYPDRAAVIKGLSLKDFVDLVFKILMISGVREVTEKN